VAEERRGDPPDTLGELGALPAGHHGLSREQIAESQRERLIAAVAEIAAERGYRAATITEVVKQASVSTRDFYEHFASTEECFLAAFEALLSHLEALIREATGAVSDWPHQVIAALRAALGFFAAEPGLARVCLIEPVTATPAIAIRFRQAVLDCVPLIARGRAELASGSGLPESTEDSLLGGLISLTSRAILAGESERLPELLPDLVEFMLSPYVGAERAKQLSAVA
jgi:AcrR family transcriptional regulator